MESTIHESFDADDADAAAEKIQKSIKAPFVFVKVDRLGGSPSIAIKVSLQPKEEWNNKIFHNSPHSIWMYDNRGLQQLTKDHKISKKFRKANPKSVDDAIKKINKWLEDVKKTLEEGFKNDLKAYMRKEKIDARNNNHADTVRNIAKGMNKPEGLVQSCLDCMVKEGDVEVRKSAKNIAEVLGGKQSNITYALIEDVEFPDTDVASAVQTDTCNNDNDLNTLEVLPPDTSFAGDDVFKVDPDTFAKCRMGHKKYSRWANYVNVKTESGHSIREFARKFPSKNIVIQNERTGQMIFLRRKGGPSMVKESSGSGPVSNKVIRMLDKAVRWDEQQWGEDAYRTRETAKMIVDKKLLPKNLRSQLKTVLLKSKPWDYDYDIISWVKKNIINNKRLETFDESLNEGAKSKKSAIAIAQKMVDALGPKFKVNEKETNEWWIQIVTTKRQNHFHDYVDSQLDRAGLYDEYVATLETRLEKGVQTADIYLKDNVTEELLSEDPLIAGIMSLTQGIGKKSVRAALPKIKELIKSGMDVVKAINKAAKDLNLSDFDRKVLLQKAKTLTTEGRRLGLKTDTNARPNVRGKSSNDGLSNDQRTEKLRSLGDNKPMSFSQQSQSLDLIADMLNAESPTEQKAAKAAFEKWAKKNGQERPELLMPMAKAMLKAKGRLRKEETVHELGEAWEIPPDKERDMVGEKNFDGPYTLYMPNGIFGYSSIHTRKLKVYHSSWAQHKKVPFAEYLGKGRRKTVAWAFSDPGARIFVVKGHGPKFDNFNPGEITDSGAIVRKGKHMGGNSAAFNDDIAAFIKHHKLNLVWDSGKGR
jgi:hypothetical protein